MSNSIFLRANGANQSLSEVISLEDLSDVTITSVSDEDIIYYDSGSGEWVNAQISATTPLSISGLTITHDNSVVTPGTYPKVTVDSKGHVTSGDSTIDISADTNLSATAPITLNGDAVEIDLTADIDWTGTHTFTNSSVGSVQIGDNGNAFAPFSIHSKNEGYWTALFYNDVYSSDPADFIFSYYGYNNGKFAMGTEVNTDLAFYTNGYNNERFIIKADGTLNVTAYNSAGFLKNDASGDLSGGNTIDISADTNLAATSPIVLTGDTLSHATSGVGAGTYTSVTVDDKGHVTAGTNPSLSYSTDFDDGDLSSSILTVTHSLGKKYCVVQVYNNNDQMIVPDEITLSSTSALTIDLSSYGTLTGTWHVIVIGGSS